MGARIGGVFLILALFFTYRPLLDADFVNYDDGAYIINNPYLREGFTPANIKAVFTSFYSANYHPLTLLAHILDYRLFGMNPTGHHLVNLILHTGNTLILFLLLREMTVFLWQSFLVALLFALHPLHVESVAWVSERKDVLSTLFLFLGLYFYFRYKKTKKVLDYTILTLSYILGLLAKPMVVTFPFLLLLLDYWPLQYLKSRSDLKPLLKEKIPFFILSAAMSVVTFLAQRAGGAVSSLDAIPLTVRLANALVAYSQYLIHVFLPTGLSIFYPHPGRDIPWGTVLLSVTLLFLISHLSFRLRREKPFLLMGWLWYLGMLVPVIGIIQVGMQAMADRYTYVPIVGIFLLFAWLIPNPEKRKGKIFFTIFILLLTLLLGVQTQRQVNYWLNTETLFSHAEAATEKNILAKLHVAAELAKKGLFSEAQEKYREIIGISPVNVQAHYALGMLLVSRGQFTEGLKYLKKANNLQPDSATVRNGLGLAYMGQGKLKAAEEFFQGAIKVKPQIPDSYYHLGKLYERKKLFAKAREAYEEALRKKPDFHEVRLALANLLLRMGKKDEALRAFDTVAEKAPHLISTAYFNLARSYAESGLIDQAINTYTQALSISPYHTEARREMAELLLREGKIKEALSQYREILKFKPRDVLAEVGIGNVYLKEGKTAEALTHLEAVVRKYPQSAPVHLALGHVWREKGELVKAKEAYLRCVELSPNLPEACYYLGLTLADLGKRGESLFYLQKALLLRPEEKRFKEALQKQLRNLGQHREGTGKFSN